MKKVRGIFLAFITIFGLGFSMNIVNAETDVTTQQIENQEDLTEEKLKELLSNITINSKEIDIIKDLERTQSCYNENINGDCYFNTVEKEVANKVSEILTTNGYIGYVVFAQYDRMDLHQWTIGVSKNGALDSEIYADIEIKYSDTKSIDTSLQNEMQNKFPNDKWFNIYEVQDTNGNVINGTYEEQIRKLLNDNSIEVYIEPTLGGGGEGGFWYGYGGFTHIYKDGLYYYSFELYVSYGPGFITESGLHISMNEIEKDSELYQEMQDKMSSKGYNNIFSAYEIEAAEEYNGTIPLTFDVGEENNGQKAYILHKKADGTFEEFTTTVENGKIQISVNELSPFVIALGNPTEIKDTNENTEQTSNKSDTSTTNNPDTGMINVSLCEISALGAFSGIMYLLKKEHN